jgi:hypothetical protein
MSDTAISPSPEQTHHENTDEQTPLLGERRSEEVDGDTEEAADAPKSEPTNRELALIMSSVWVSEPRRSL